MKNNDLALGRFLFHDTDAKNLQVFFSPVLVILTIYTASARQI